MSQNFTSFYFILLLLIFPIGNIIERLVYDELIYKSLLIKNYIINNLILKINNKNKILELK